MLTTGDKVEALSLAQNEIIQITLVADYFNSIRGG